MKHGRSARGAAPTSNAAGRDDAQGTLMPARPATSRHVVPRGFHMLLANASQRGSDSGRFARNQADSGRNSKKEKKKKKKGAERTI